MLKLRSSFGGLLGSKVASAALPALGTFLALCLSAAEGRAQAPAADLLFEQGRRALAEGDLQTACSRFRASDALDPAGGTRANIGECEERRGRVASAWEAYRSALRKLPEDDRRVAKIKARLAALDARLPTLEIVLAPGASQGTTASEGGVVVGQPGTFGVPLPVDPGTHEISVQVPGMSPQTIEVVLSEGEHRKISVGGAPAIPATPAAPRPSPRSSPSPTSTSGRVGPWALGGAGFASLVVGAVTGGLAIKDREAVVVGCSASSMTCTSSGKAAADQGRAVGPVAIAALAAGGVAVAGAGLWLGVDGKATGSKVGFSVSAKPFGAEVEVSW